MVRDLRTGVLIDDLNFIGRTNSSRVRRGLRKKRDLEVTVEVAASDETAPIAWEDQDMSDGDSTQYRAIVARSNFLSIDRPDIMYASKECSRRMSRPTNGDWAALKRLGRYLLSKPRLVHLFRWQDKPTTLTAFSDSNWAGCQRTRKSTSGACYLHGSHLIKASSKTQANIALSSGEAEFYSMVGATSEALGLKAMMVDYEDGLDPWLYVDASAAIGVAQRTGLGKIRHLDTGSLWLQEAVKKKQIGILKVKGTENPSDLMTKFTDLATLEKMCDIMSLEVRGGRAASAPKTAEHAEDKTVKGSDDIEHENMIIEQEVMAIDECDETSSEVDRGAGEHDDDQNLSAAIRLCKNNVGEKTRDDDDATRDDDVKTGGTAEEWLGRLKYEERRMAVLRTANRRERSRVWRRSIRKINRLVSAAANGNRMHKDNLMATACEIAQKQTTVIAGRGSAGELMCSVHEECTRSGYDSNGYRRPHWESQGEACRQSIVCPSTELTRDSAVLLQFRARGGVQIPCAMASTRIRCVCIVRYVCIGRARTDRVYERHRQLRCYVGSRSISDKREGGCMRMVLRSIG